MVRLPSLIFVASFLTCLVNSSVVVGKAFLKRAAEEEICGAADYFICSDGATCCPNGFLCVGDGCVKAPDTTTNDPSNTDVIITVTVTASPKNTALSTGAIAGIAVGGVIILAAIGVGVFFCMRKRKIGKEVLKAYEDPTRNMYDEVVVEGKRISVVPIGGTTPQQRRQTQTQTQLPPPSEAQEFAGIEGTSEIAVGMQTQPEDQYSQQQYQQPQQYQSYQQQPQQMYYQQQVQEQLPQGTELSADQTYPPAQPAPSYDSIPDSLRVGSPVSPIRADSMGLIPVGVDSADGGQHPYQFSPVPGTMRHHSTALPPPPHLTTDPTPAPHSTSPPPQTPTPNSPIYYQSPSPPPRITSPQTPGGYYTQQAYTQQGVPNEQSPPNNRYSQYPQYQQYPPPPPPEPISSPVSPIQTNKRYSIHPPNGQGQSQNPQRTGTGNYSDWRPL